MNNEIKKTPLYKILLIIVVLEFFILIIYLIKLIPDSNLAVINIEVLVITNCFIGGVTVWNAYRSPSAKLAEIEKSRQIRDLRQEHYENLKFYVIEPLSKCYLESRDSGGDIFQKQKIFFNIDKIRENCVFDDAMQHLNIKYPKFNVTLDFLYSEINQFNQEIELFKNEIQSRIRSEISEKNINTTDDAGAIAGSVYFFHVFSSIQNQWKKIIDNPQLRENQELLESEISKMKSIEKDDRSELWIQGCLIAKGIDESSEKKIVDLINDYSKNQKILRQYFTLSKKRASFYENWKILREQCEEVAAFIDAKKYNDVIECCPYSL